MSSSYRFLLSYYWTVSRYSQPAAYSLFFFFMAMQFPIVLIQNQFNLMESLKEKLSAHNSFLTQYKENRLKETDKITDLETRLILYIINIEKYDQPFKLTIPDWELTKKLSQKFCNIEALFGLVEENMFDPSFLEDFTLVFPYQLTLFRMLEGNTPILKSLYKALMGKQQHKIAISFLVEKAQSILNRAHWLIEDYSQQGSTKEVFIEQMDLIRILSDPTCIRASDSQSTVDYRSVYSKDFVMKPGCVLKRNENIQILRDAAMEILDNLFQYRRMFNLKLRYVMKLLSQQEMYIQLDLIDIIQRHLIGSNKSQYFKQNSKTMADVLRNAVKKHDSVYVDEQYGKLVKDCHQKIRKIFQEAINIDEEYITKYDSRRTLCCLSSTTLQNIGMIEEADITQSYYFNARKFEQAGPFRKQLQIQQQIAKLTYTCPFVKLFDFMDILPLLTSNWKQSQLFEVSNNLQKKLKELRYMVHSQTRSVNDYCQMLTHSTSKQLNLLKLLEKYDIKIIALNQWNNLIIQKDLTLTVTQTGLNFGIQQPDSYTVSTLNQFAQCFAYSSIISKQILTGNNLSNLNNVLSQYLGLICTALRKKHNSQLIFQAIRQELMTFFFLQWHISDGKSLKDMTIHRYCEKTKPSLKDFDLAHYSDQQDFFIELAQPCFDKISHTTNISTILQTFNEMISRVHYIIKIRNPKAVISGDSQMSILNFLVCRSGIKNFSSLLNFTEVCWYMETGALKYIWANLRSVEAIILQNAAK